MKRTVALAITFALASSVAFAQGGGGSSGSSSGGGAASSTGSTSPAGSPRAGSAGAGTTGVNGVPPGPANAAGLNNSGNDPSGSGNAPNFSSETTTGIANPSSDRATQSSSNVPSGDGALRGNGTRMPGPNAPTTTSNRDSDAKIDTENRKLDQTVKSICKGC